MKRIYTSALLMGFALTSFGFSNWQRPKMDIGAASTGSSATMEAAVAVQKPKVVYAQFVAQHQPKQTVADIIGRFISEMNGLDGQVPVKPLGESHEYNLKRLQRLPIGLKVAEKLTKGDIIAHCRARQAQGVLPQTVMGDITALTGALKYAGSAWDDCEEVSDAAVLAAKPFLIKHNLIAKSQPRTRRPQPEEVQALLALFERHNARERNKIDMVRIAKWQLASSRRISESCRLLWTDWDRENCTMLVRKMKDPRNRNKNKVVALPAAAQALLVEWYETRDPNEPRILPFNSKSCSARYTMGKKEVGIEGLRLHDSRRDCFTRLVEDDGFSLEEAILVTGHETIAVPQRTYLAQKPELLRHGPRARRISESLATIKAMDTGFTERYEPVAVVRAAVETA